MGDRGCNLGVREPLPRTPLIFREKKRWRLKDWPWPLEPQSENYSSAVRLEHVVRAKLAEELPLGRVKGPCSRQEAAAACGCKPSELVPGQLGVIEEGDDRFRVLFGGSVTGVNHKIRPLDQHECPGLAEAELMQRLSQTRTPTGRMTKYTIFQISTSNPPIV